MLRSIMCSIMMIASSIVMAGSAAAAPGDITVIGPGAWPKWSPDGQLIAFVADGYLQITPSDGKGERARLTEHSGRWFDWVSDSEIICSQRASKRSDTTLFRSVSFQRTLPAHGKSIQIATVEPPLVLASPAKDRNLRRVIHPNPLLLRGEMAGFIQDRCAPPDEAIRVVPFRRSDRTDSVLRMHRELIIRQEGNPCSPSWGAIWWVPVSDSGPPARRLTEDEQFGMMEMAPTGDKFIALSLERQAWVILDTAGKEINGRFEPQGRVDDTGYLRGAVGMGWSPDGTRLCYMRSWGDGHYTYDYRLCVSDIANHDVVELLGSDYGDLAPSGYSWSPSGRHIAVATEKSGIVIVEVAP